jgi:hypothetical protein
MIDLSRRALPLACVGLRFRGGFGFRDRLRLPLLAARRSRLLHGRPPTLRFPFRLAPPPRASSAPLLAVGNSACAFARFSSRAGFRADTTGWCGAASSGAVAASAPPRFDEYASPDDPIVRALPVLSAALI